MFHYSVYGLAVESDTPLPELAGVSDFCTQSKERVRIHLKGLGNQRSEPAAWFLSSRLPDGQSWLRAARTDEGFLLRYADLADFLIDRPGDNIHLGRVASEASPDTIRHLALDQVLPMVLSLRGEVPLHATAVLTPKGVCAFLGATGAGKSALAASFCLAGYPLMSDDCLVLRDKGRIFALPGYPGVRLWPDAAETLGGALRDGQPVAHYTAKRRTLGSAGVNSFAAEPGPLAAIYEIEREQGAGTGSPVVRRLAGREAFIRLASASFILDVGEQAVLERHFRFIERLLAQVPFSVLCVPNDFNALPAVRNAVLVDREN